MEPMIRQGDTLVVREVPGNEVQHGDVVMFSADSWGDPGILLVKRVAGIGGDTVACCDPEHRLTVNGKAIAEEYLRPVEVARLAYREYTVRVPPGHVWVLGDWRDNSRDSRNSTDDPAQGVIPTTDIRGVVVSVAGEDLTTKAFTDAGLSGAPYQDSLRGTMRIVMAGGGVLFLGGIVWLIAALRRRDKQEA